ncbi:MAG: hypothetical protein RLZZ458_1994 [Planctomycetota bacterium]
MVDPLSAFGELLVASFTWGEAEVVTDSGGGHGESLAVQQRTQAEQVFRGDGLREVVAGELGGGEFLFGAEGDELFEVHFGGGDLFG